MRLSRPVGLAPNRVPHVEVVVPCHNYGRYLPGCVESILLQPGVSTEVTIVDDASTDDSAQVAERLAEQYAAVKLLRNEVNIGAVRTFNRGLNRADSDYVLLLSADDLVAPGALARATALMEANPGVGMVYGHAQKFAETPVPHRPLPAVSWSTWRGDEWIELQLRRAWNNISSPEALVRTSVQHAAGEYDPDLPHTHDVEMWLRIAALAGIGHINGADQAFYRRHARSLSAGVGIYQEIWQRWRAYDRFLTGWSRQDVATRLRPQARRRLVNEALTDLLDQLEHGGAPDEVADAALGLVRDIDPDADARALWQDVQAARGGDVARDPAALRRRAVRELAHRSRWHRWHRFRYFG